MRCSPDYGPLFGCDCDIGIYSNSNTRNDNFSITKSYQQPEYTGIPVNDYLAGAQYFKVTEIEVFKIQ